MNKSLVVLYIDVKCFLRHYIYRNALQLKSSQAQLFFMNTYVGGMVLFKSYVDDLIRLPNLHYSVLIKYGLNSNH